MTFTVKQTFMALQYSYYNFVTFMAHFITKATPMDRIASLHILKHSSTCYAGSILCEYNFSLRANTRTHIHDWIWEN